MKMSRSFKNKSKNTDSAKRDNDKNNINFSRPEYSGQSRKDFFKLWLLAKCL